MKSCELMCLLLLGRRKISTNLFQRIENISEYIVHMKNLLIYRGRKNPVVVLTSTAVVVFFQRLNSIGILLNSFILKTSFAYSHRCVGSIVKILRECSCSISNVLEHRTYKKVF